MSSLKVKRSLQGAVLGVGAPLGWLLVQVYQGAELDQEIWSNWGLYTYMLLGTVFVFAGFGYYAGHQESMLYNLAIRDGLTGLYNRRYFCARLAEEFDKAKRHHAPLSIVFFDVDRFKRINDTYGHAGGDALLRALGEILREKVRVSEVVGRLGGEEFGLILCNNSEESYAIVQRLQTAIRELKLSIGVNMFIEMTASFGIATLREECTSGTDLLEESDQALYQAKNDGGDCIRVFTKESHHPSNAGGLRLGSGIAKQ